MGVVQDVARSGECRIRHQDVDVAGLGQQTADLTELRQVRSDRCRTELRRKGFKHVEPSAREDELGTFSRQRTGDCLPDASRSARHEGA